jgi:hypothetical protein
MVEFLGVPAAHSEADLHNGLVEQLKRFLIELGRDFCFVGSQYPLQVGKRDFALDLLFFNRALNCLMAIELKIDEFQPEHLGKLEFYLEALDRDVKKPHERPSIGVLLCATKDHEVVRYALSRAASPALVAEYQTRLPEKKFLQAKLHEFYAVAEAKTTPPAIESRGATSPKLTKPRKRRKKQIETGALTHLKSRGVIVAAEQRADAGFSQIQSDESLRYFSLIFHCTFPARSASGCCSNTARSRRKISSSCPIFLSPSSRLHLGLQHGAVPL